MRIKPSCRHCHFLNKTYYNYQGPQGSSSWGQEDRNNLGVKDLGPLSGFIISCWRGVWDEGVDPSVRERLPGVLTKNRRGKCFFVEYQKGMTYEGAENLFHERQQNANKRRSNAAIAISAGALLASLIYPAVDMFLV